MHPLSPLAAGGAAFGASVIAELAYLVRNKPSEPRWKWRRLLIATSLFWLVGLMAAALLAAPALNDFRGETESFAAAVRTAFWFTAGSLLALMSVDTSTRPARPLSTAANFWIMQLGSALFVAMCVGIYFVYDWWYPEATYWSEFQQGHAILGGAVWLAHLLSTTAFYLYGKYRRSPVEADHMGDQSNQRI